jgi:transcriptional regulator with XRE-family HTH domain
VCVLGKTPSRGIGLELTLVAALRGVTRRQLAKATGIGYDRVARILRDDGSPTPAELEALWRAVRAEPRR